MNNPTIDYKSPRGSRLCNPRPVVLAALGLCLGIYLSRATNQPMLGLVMLLGTLGLLLLKCRWFALFTLCAALGLFRALLAVPGPVATGTGTLTGRVCEQPQWGRDGHVLTLNNASIGGVSLPGRVVLAIGDYGLSPAYGQIVEATAQIRPSQPAKRPGGYDEQVYDWSRGIAARAKADTATLFAGRTDAYGGLLSLRETLEDNLAALYGPRLGPLATGMLLGDKSQLDSDLLGRFQGAGLSHLLAVSGLHVSLLCAALLWALKRAPIRVRIGIAAGFLLLYCAMCAFSASAVRAALMTLSMLSGQALRRRPDSLSALSFSAVLLLLINPFFLFTAGFLLSYTAVIGILLVTPVLSTLLKPLPPAISTGLATTLGAQLGSLPVTAACFGEFPIAGFVTNLVAVPLSGLALIPSLLAAICYGFVPGLAKLFGIVGEGALLLMSGAAGFTAARFPFVSIPGPSLFAGLLYFLSFTFFSRFCLLGARSRGQLGGLCLALCAVLWALGK